MVNEHRQRRTPERQPGPFVDKEKVQRRMIDLYAFKDMACSHPAFNKAKALVSGALPLPEPYLVVGVGPFKQAIERAQARCFERFAMEHLAIFILDFRDEAREDVWAGGLGRGPERLFDCFRSQLQLAIALCWAPGPSAIDARNQRTCVFRLAVAAIPAIHRDHGRWLYIFNALGRLPD